MVVRVCRKFNFELGLWLLSGSHLVSQYAVTMGFKRPICSVYAMSDLTESVDGFCGKVHLHFIHLFWRDFHCFNAILMCRNLWHHSNASNCCTWVHRGLFWNDKLWSFESETKIFNNIFFLFLLNFSLVWFACYFSSRVCLMLLWKVL